jgi:phosphoglucomutase
MDTAKARPGERATAEMLIDVGRLEREYYECRPDPGIPAQQVSFGTSGHRGTPGEGTFNEAHILAISQAICDYRRSQGITGPLYLGKDTHAVSPLAERTALEVLAANGVEAFYQREDGFTPTPAISRAILVHNRAHPGAPADGIILTPSHNPPEDGGIKYNPPMGGPAETAVTAWIQERANVLLRAGNDGVERIPYERALRASNTHPWDFVLPYVRDLALVIDMEAIRSAGVKLAVDPLGGAALAYWEPINTFYGLSIEVVNPRLDPTFAFMTVDHDGKIRMDCSSPDAMAGLVGLKERFDVAFGNDPDADRHGIVTPRAGLMNPNHLLAVAIDYLLTHRPEWPAAAAVGKTLVSSSIIDRVVARRGRRLAEVPVGFKWFAPKLFDGSYCFGGEESAGASLLERGGAVWTTDKDGPVMGLLAAEITAVTGNDPGERYRTLTETFGLFHYTRQDTAATKAERDRLTALAPEDVTATELAGEPILARLTRAPSNNEPIQGLKIVASSGWFAARPSGTEEIYKIYAESYADAAHLERIVATAREIVTRAVSR